MHTGRLIQNSYTSIIIPEKLCWLLIRPYGYAITFTWELHKGLHVGQADREAHAMKLLEIFRAEIWIRPWRAEIQMTETGRVKKKKKFTERVSVVSKCGEIF